MEGKLVTFDINFASNHGLTAAVIYYKLCEVYESMNFGEQIQINGNDYMQIDLDKSFNFLEIDDVIENVRKLQAIEKIFILMNPEVTLFRIKI